MFVDGGNFSQWGIVADQSHLPFVTTNGKLIGLSVLMKYVNSIKDGLALKL